MLRCENSPEESDEAAAGTFLSEGHEFPELIEAADAFPFSGLFAFGGTFLRLGGRGWFGEFVVEFVDEAGFGIVWKAGDETAFWSCRGAAGEMAERVFVWVPFCEEGGVAADVRREEGAGFVEVAGGDSEVGF